MRLGTSIQTSVAVVFGLGFFAFGITNFVRMDRSERRLEIKLHAIQSGAIQPDPLTALEKYVNPGRSGLPHIVFSSAGQTKVDITATTEFFNSVKPGDTIPGYFFPDGYLIPENHRASTRGGKWLFLALAVLLGAGPLAMARAMIRMQHSL